MKEITVNLEPPYVIVRPETDAFQRGCTSNEIRAVLELLGAENWPLKECFIKMMISEDDKRLPKIIEILGRMEKRAA